MRPSVVVIVVSLSVPPEPGDDEDPNDEVIRLHFRRLRHTCATDHPP